MQKTVAVFFGGRSNEHEISVITGMYAVNLLRGAGYRVLPVYLPREGGMAYADARGVKDFADPDFPPAYLLGSALYSVKKRKKLYDIDCALNCCHGGAGEDGTLSALLEWNGIASASPGIVVSSVFMDKSLGKIAARGLGIPVADAVCVRSGEDAEQRMRENGLTFPVIVKPVTLGSSIGIRVAENAEALQEALTLAFRLDSAALVEEYFKDKRDVNCAAVRKNGRVETSECEEVFTSHEILSFEDKYESAPAKKSEMPANLPEGVAEKIRTYTKLIYETFGVRGVVRADFLVSGDNVYFNELNTVPGSLSCYLFGETLISARAFLVALVEEALVPRKEKKQIVVTGILNDGVFSGRKGMKR